LIVTDSWDRGPECAETIAGWQGARLRGARRADRGGFSALTVDEEVRVRVCGRDRVLASVMGWSRAVSRLSGSRTRGLGRPDGRSHGSEFGRFAAGVLERRVGVRVEQLALGDVGVCPLDQQARVLAVEQRPGDSAGPEVDSVARVL
jgi:hypothetical protein